MDAGVEVEADEDPDLRAKGPVTKGTLDEEGLTRLHGSGESDQFRPAALGHDQDAGVRNPALVLERELGHLAVTLTADGVSEVDIEIVLTLRQGQRRHVGSSQTVEIEGLRYAVRQRAGIDYYGVGPRSQVGEQVLPVTAGGLEIDNVAITVEKDDQHVVDSRLVEILLTVSVEVLPHPVADRTQLRRCRNRLAVIVVIADVLTQRVGTGSRRGVVPYLGVDVGLGDRVGARAGLARTRRQGQDRVAARAIDRRHQRIGDTDAEERQVTGVGHREGVIDHVADVGRVVVTEVEIAVLLQLDGGGISTEDDPAHRAAAGQGHFQPADVDGTENHRLDAVVAEVGNRRQGDRGTTGIEGFHRATGFASVDIEDTDRVDEDRLVELEDDRAATGVVIRVTRVAVGGDDQHVAQVDPVGTDLTETATAADARSTEVLIRSTEIVVATGRVGGVKDHRRVVDRIVGGHVHAEGHVLVVDDRARRQVSTAAVGFEDDGRQADAVRIIRNRLAVIVVVTHRITVRIVTGCGRDVVADTGIDVVLGDGVAAGAGLARTRSQRRDRVTARASYRRHQRIGDAHRGQGHVTGVGHLERVLDEIADITGSVGTEIEGAVLDQLDCRILWDRLTVVVVVAHRIAVGIVARRRRGVVADAGVDVGLGDRVGTGAGLAVSRSHRRDRVTARAGDRRNDRIADHDVGQVHVAGVGHLERVTDLVAGVGDAVVTEVQSAVLDQLDGGRSVDRLGVVVAVLHRITVGIGTGRRRGVVPLTGVDVILGDGVAASAGLAVSRSHRRDRVATRAGDR